MKLYIFVSEGVQLNALAALSLGKGPLVHTETRNLRYCSSKESINAFIEGYFQSVVRRLKINLKLLT